MSTWEGGGTVTMIIKERLKVWEGEGAKFGMGCQIWKRLYWSGEHSLSADGPGFDL